MGAPKKHQSSKCHIKFVYYSIKFIKLLENKPRECDRKKSVIACKDAVLS